MGLEVYVDADYTEKAANNRCSVSWIAVSFGGTVLL